jgi:hypothetical protein
MKYVIDLSGMYPAVRTSFSSDILWDWPDLPGYRKFCNQYLQTNYGKTSGLGWKRDDFSRESAFISELISQMIGHTSEPVRPLEVAEILAGHVIGDSASAAEIYTIKDMINSLAFKGELSVGYSDADTTIRKVHGDYDHIRKAGGDGKLMRKQRFYHLSEPQMEEFIKNHTVRVTEPGTNCDIVFIEHDL